MALGAIDFARHTTLSVFALAVISAVLWKVVPYVRMRFALLAVSKIPGPPSQSILSGRYMRLLSVVFISTHQQGTSRSTLRVMGSNSIGESLGITALL